jgi:hypothetical protein
VKRPMDRLDTAKVSFRNFGNHFPNLSQFPCAIKVSI